MLSYLKCFEQCDFHLLLWKNSEHLNVLDQKTECFLEMLTDTASLPGCISMRGKIIATTYLNVGIILLAFSVNLMLRCAFECMCLTITAF